MLKFQVLELIIVWSLVHCSAGAGSELVKGSSVNSKAVNNDNISSYLCIMPIHKCEQVECEACGKALAQTRLDEHVVSVHLTIEGLCNICGEDMEDFVWIIQGTFKKLQS